MVLKKATQQLFCYTINSTSSLNLQVGCILGAGLDVLAFHVAGREVWQSGQMCIEGRCIAMTLRLLILLREGYANLFWFKHWAAEQ